MKKNFTLSLLFFISQLATYSQDGTIKALKKDAERSISKNAADTVLKAWKTGGNFGLNLNQGTLSNWSAGGDKFSLSVNSLLNLFAFHKKGKNSWDNSIDLAYGIVKTTSLGTRKASDRIDLLSKYGHAISAKWNAGALFNLRSQFANGYNYLKDISGADSAVLTSKTFAPAYLLLSPGFDYKPTASLSLFVSPITGRWVIVGDKILAAEKYGFENGKTVKTEFGAFASINFNKTINKTAGFRSKLDLFSNYRNNPQNIDIFWTNMLTAKVTRYINFNLQVDMIYDDDIQNVKPDKGPAPQILQLMGIGFSYNFANYNK
ncbi:MAG: DUF3078 domain-containing protein [Chitinophagaceae bacterium]|nr:MAG: DUF3078 domain-containing protein [Chitinophagaceae bacterium]